MWKPKLSIAVHEEQCVVIPKQKQTSLFFGHLNDLPEYIRQARLYNAPCSLILPVRTATVKTITLETTHRYALSAMARQAVFWQEYCGIEADQFQCRWCMLPSPQRDSMKVLLVAVHREDVAYYQGFLKTAKIRPIEFTLQCFQLFALTQTQACHCVLVLSPHTAYVFAGSHAQYNLQTLATIPQSEQGRSHSPDWQQFLDGLAGTIQGLSATAEMQKTVGESISVTAVNMLENMADATLTKELAHFLPDEFVIQTTNPTSLVERCQVDHPQVNLAPCNQTAQLFGAVLAWQQLQHPRATLTCPNLLPRLPLSQHPQWMQVRWFVRVLSVLILIVSGLQHKQLSDAQQKIMPQLNAYHNLVTVLQQKQKQNLRLAEAIQQHEAVFSLRAAARHSGEQALRFLNLIDTETPKEIAIDKIEFTAPQQLHIDAYVQTEAFVSKYATALNKDEVCSDLQIQDIATTEFAGLKYFSIHCGSRFLEQTPRQELDEGKT